MITLEPSFDRLMTRLKDGDDAAAEVVFHHFARQVIRLARQQLYKEIRYKADPESVVQSVFRSFFKRQKDGRFTLENWDNLWGLLTTMTLRKRHRRLEHLRAACRDVQREVSLESGLVPIDDELKGREPSPLEAAILAEMLNHLLEGLTESDREVLELHFQGFTSLQISEQVGRAARTIRRIIDRTRRHLLFMDHQKNPTAAPKKQPESR